MIAKTKTAMKVEEEDQTSIVEDKMKKTKEPISSDDAANNSSNDEDEDEDDNTEEIITIKKAEESKTPTTAPDVTQTVEIALPEAVTSNEHEESDATNSDATNSDATNSDQEAETTASSSSGSYSSPEESREQEDEIYYESEDEEVLTDVRLAIANGMNELTFRQRSQISEEVHGVRHFGIPLEDLEVQHLFLKKFQAVLDMVVSGSVPLPNATTAAYELCLRKNYAYATLESQELRLMCLRTELWDAPKACERFLHHLNALLKYYGEDALRTPLTIDQLDREEHKKINKNKNNNNRIMNKCVFGSVSRDIHKKGGRKQSKKTAQSEQNRGIYKKGKGGSKRKGSLDSLPDMLALKSGFIQVLPSRDRSGRRVVVLQPTPSIATEQQTQKQVQYSKFKAMIYFLTSFLRRDLDAQRKGFVLILNSTKTDEKHEEEVYGTELLQQYAELCRSIPVRICALHFAFDRDSTESTPHKICRTILESFLENDPKMNVGRVYLYDRDVSNDATKDDISPFGIPTHQIPLTHTGTIKLKEHNGWVKIQEWFDKKSKQGLREQTKFNIIECPGTNDVLFSQGGKYWNGVNRFQRGNLEFMEFLESKIDLYQSTLSWKKKHTILAAVVREFARTPQSTGKYARFLETATQIEGVMAPDGCWVELPLTSPLLMQKIRQTLLNHIRRLESSGKRKPASTKATRQKKDKTAAKDTKKQEKAQAAPVPTTSQVVGKPEKEQTTQPEKPKPSEKTKKNIPVAKDRGWNKRRKIALVDSISPLPFKHPVTKKPSTMKDNKLAISTFGNNLNSSIQASLNGGGAANYEAAIIHKQAICEFLANAERIAVSTAAVDIACENHNRASEGGSLRDAIANDEKLVQAIIANDDRLNKEVGELFEMDSFLRDEGESSDVEREIESDEIADCLMGCML